MSLRHARDGYGRVLSWVLSFAIVLSSTAFSVGSGPEPAFAAPTLAVSATVTDRPLLGGTATFSVTIRNTSADPAEKAYNIGLAGLIGSSRPHPEGRVTYTGSSLGAPTSISTDPATGQTDLSFLNFRDLAGGESTTVDVTVALTDPTWQVGDSIDSTFTASGYLVPDGTSPLTPAQATASANVVPIKITSKSVQQSTSAQQATGLGAGRPFTYTIDVQNNYVGETTGCVVTDELPDGVEFLGTVSGPALDGGFPIQDPATGKTQLRWTLSGDGTMAASESATIVYSAGIRYDFYGTDNGGINAAATASEPTTWGARIPDGTTFNNVADLTARWSGAEATDTANANVTGKYVTTDKHLEPGVGGNGTICDYHIRVFTSQYYDALDLAPDSLLVHDTLPDGQAYSTATPAPDTVTPNADGTTDIYWRLDGLNHAGSGVSPAGVRDIFLTSVVATNWVEPTPPYDSGPVIAGDSMTNSVETTSAWRDVPDPTREGVSHSGDTARFTVRKPNIDKKMQQPGTAVWSDEVSATVGDTVPVRVRFNTTDGTSPEFSDVIMGDIVCTDWLPPGTSFVPGSLALAYSDAGDFSQPMSTPSPSINPTGAPYPESIGGLSGVTWFLGDVAKGGWWQAEFDVTVDDVAAVADGVETSNLWKSTGLNTLAEAYSERDTVVVGFTEPDLHLSKVATSVPEPLEGAGDVVYEISIENRGGATAQDVEVSDLIPVGMRDTTPTIDSASLDGSPLTSGVDFETAYDSATGTFTVDFKTASLDTPIPPGSTLTLFVRSTVDDLVGAGTTLTDLATVGWNTQPDGSGRVYPGTTDPADPNTDEETVETTRLSVSKMGTPSALTVGEVATYTVEVRVPAGAVAYWPSLFDLIRIDGVEYVPLSASLTDLSGSPVTGASFESGNSTPTVETAGSNQTILRWLFADPIDNTGQPEYRFQLQYAVTFTGLDDDGTSWEFFVPTANDSYNDQAVVLWNSFSTPERVTNRAASSNLVTTQVDQPLLALDKTITSGGPYAGGSPIAYRYVVENVGWSDAYDLTTHDAVPVAIDSVAVSQVEHSTLGVLTPVTDYTVSVASGTLDITLANGISLAPSDTLTVDYGGSIDTSIGAGATLTNTADVDWTSLPAGYPDRRVYNDGPQEAAWTQDTDSATANVQTLAIDKRILTASPVTIGDTVRYAIDVTVPSNTVAYTPDIVDRITRDGLAYVPGSAQIIDTGGTPGLVSFATTSTPTRSTTGSNLTTFTWNLATIDNSAKPELTFTLQFDLVITGFNDTGGWVMAPPEETQDYFDDATVAWAPTPGGSPLTQESPSPYVTVQQPLLSQEKAAVTPGPYPGGSIVRYEATVTNEGLGTAYTLSWDDVLPAEAASASLVGVRDSITGTLTAGVDYWADFTTPPTMSIAFHSAYSLPDAATFTVVYDMTLNPSVGSGAVMTNTADVDWATLPTGYPDRRIFNDASGETGWTADTAQASITAPESALTKSSSVTTATIGQVFNYDVIASIPTSTTLYDFSMADTVPDGLTVLLATRSPILGDITVFPEVSGATPVVWDNWDASNPPTSVATMTVSARVDSAFNGGAPVSGLPPQSVLNNRGTLDWNATPTGSPQNVSSNIVPVTIVEPNLTHAKAADVTTAAAGDTITYTATMTNTGTSDAWNMTWQDSLPAQLENAQLVGVVHSVLGTLTAGVDYDADFSGDPLTVDLDLAGSPAIAPSGTIRIVYTADVRASIAAGDIINDATITSYQSLKNGGGFERTYPPVDASTTVQGVAPELTTTKTVVGDQYVRPGDPVSWRVSVTNIGGSTAFDVSVTDTLPVDTAYLAGSTSAAWPGGTSSSDPTLSGGDSIAFWDLGAAADLDPGQTLTIDFTTDTDPGIAAGAVVNNAFAGGVDGGGGAFVTPPADATAYVTNPGVTVLKQRAAGQDPYVQPGESVDFDLVVTNSGDTDMATVPLGDTYDPTVLGYSSGAPAPVVQSPGQLYWANVGPLAVGETTTVTVTFTAIAPPSGSDTTTNSIETTQAVDVHGDTAPPSSAEATQGVTDPQVTVAKSLVSPASGFAPIGTPASWDLAVTNSGDTTLTTVPLADTYIPTWLQFTSASVPPDSSTPGALGWTDIGPLAPGETTTVTASFLVIAQPPSKIATDTATVDGAIDLHGDRAPTSSSQSSVNVTDPSVLVSKALAPGQNPWAQPGDRVEFVIGVTNTGDTTLATVPVTDTYVPADLTFIESTPTADAAISGLVSWSNVGPLAPSETTTIQVAFTASNPPPANSTIDTATVAGAIDEHGYVVATSTAQASIGLIRPHVAVTKQRQSWQSQYVEIGDPVAYRITVTNDGDDPLVSVPLRDTFDSTRLAFVEASPTETSVGADTVSWADLGPLAVDASHSVDVTFTATSLGTSVVDTATVAGAVGEKGLIAPTDTDTDSTLTIANPHVSVLKTLAAGQSASVEGGDSVVYDIAVTNDGSITMETVPLTDAYPYLQLEFLSASPAVSSQTTGTLDWTDVTGAGSLAVGETTTVTATFKAIGLGTSLVDTATVAGATSTGGLVAPSVVDTAAVSVHGSNPAQGAIELVKSADPPDGTVLLPGDEITYRVTYTNTTEKIYTDVELRDAIDPSITYVDGSLTAGSYDPATRTVTVPIAVLGPNGTGYFEFRAIVGPEEVSAKGVPNQATAVHDGSTVSTSNRVVHPVDPFTITKTATDINGGKVVAGDILRWTIVVTNTGIIPTTHVRVTDTVPSQTTYINGSITGRGGDDGNAPNLVWNVGTMAVDEKVTLTFESRVKSGLPAGTRIINQAVVTADQSRAKASTSPQSADGGPTVVVVQTSGDEGRTLSLAILLGMLGVAFVTLSTRRRRKTA